MGFEGDVRTFRNLGFSEAVIHEGATVKVVFKATLVRRPDNTPHSVGLSIDRYVRRRREDPWPSIPSEHIPVDGKAFEAAFGHMAAWRDVLPLGRSTRYLTLTIDRDHPNPDAIVQLLGGLRRNPHAFLPVMRLLSTDDTLALQAASNLARMRRSREALVHLIAQDPPEHQFQKWFEAHPWIFGSEYVVRIPVRKVGIKAQADFLLRTADGFVDLFELKRPSAQVLRWDESHDVWSPTRALADAIGQVLSYLETMDDYKFNLRDEFGLPVVYPRVRLVIGSSEEWDDVRRRALRRLNAHLTRVEILTFDHVLARADAMIGHLADSLGLEADAG